MSMVEFENYLRSNGPLSAGDICRRFNISQPTFSRIIRSMRHQLVIGGKARSTRYAISRDIAGVGSIVPLYKIDEDGGSSRAVDMHAIWPKGFYLKSDWFEDLPYFLADLRPNGFLGHLIPLRHPDLSVPADIRLWNADHCLAYLARFETDGIGDLIVGDDAFRKYLSLIKDPPASIAPNERSHLYPKMADDVLAHGPAGSSAGGEQPKFLTSVGPSSTSMIVKFSPPVKDDVSRRHADLLVCEHISHGVLKEHGIDSPRSEIILGGDRFFLEIERFDRVGARGRRGVISLEALAMQFSGTLGRWSDVARGLLQREIIDTEAHHTICWLEAYGTLIANTDMHCGNISFHTRNMAPVRVAPVYDMLPMLYFPSYGQIISKNFEPLPSIMAGTSEWKEVRSAAEDFWVKVSVHTNISDGFRIIARDNAAKIKAL